MNYYQDIFQNTFLILQFYYIRKNNKFRYVCKQLRKYKLY